MASYPRRLLNLLNNSLSDCFKREQMNVGRLLSGKVVGETLAYAGVLQANVRHKVNSGKPTLQCIGLVLSAIKINECLTVSRVRACALVTRTAA